MILSKNYRQILKPLANVSPMMVFIFGIALLSTACNLEPYRPDDANYVAGDGNRRVCRSEAATGTRLSSRICKTAEEWEAIDEAEARSGSEYMRKTDDRSTVTSGTQPGGDAYAGQGTTAVSQ